MMISPALSQLLDRARMRYGVDVEVLDGVLESLYPEGGSDLRRIIDYSPVARRALLHAMANGAAEHFDVDGTSYRLYPLRKSLERKQVTGLLAVRAGASQAANAADADPWSDFARAAVEAELASAEKLGDARQHSRRLAGAFRFAEFMSETSDESSLSHSLVQAAAVWYDVDARIYRRDLSGAFVLHTWLAGVRPDPRLSHEWTFAAQGPQQLASAAEFGDTGIGNDALLVPLTSDADVNWVLVLIGALSQDAESVLRPLARMAGIRYAAFADRRAAVARQQFDAHLADTTRVPELVAVRVVHDVAHSVEASSASLSLTRLGRTRRIAAVGKVSAEDVDNATVDQTRSTARIVCSIQLGGDDSALLDLRTDPSRQFSPDDARVAAACASALRTWLAGTLTSFDATAAILDVSTAGVPPFLTRIQEELERARRFDLRLSLILIDGQVSSDVMAELQESLRRELRGSDVTGTMSGTQVAALLTHTDALGLDNVVRRVRQRLADTAERLNVSGLKLGQAAFSPEVRTADALLELALRQAEPVMVH